MTNGRRGAQQAGIGVDRIDLGHEPPLSVDGESNGLVDRRRISIQWFSGILLTGLCGAGLMAGAVYASLDGESTFARLPERFENALRGALSGAERIATAVRKSDRLPTASELTAQRQVIKVSTTSKVGNREVVRVRPLIHVSSNLLTTVSDLTASLPPFNAQKLLADQGNQDAAPGTNSADTAAASDAEVSFVTRDLGQVLPHAKIAALLPIDQVIARVRKATPWLGGTDPVLTASVPGVDQSGVRLAYAASDADDPYGGFEPRIVPENVTLLPKTADITSMNERVVLIKKGDTLASVLKDIGATPDEIKGFVGALGKFAKDGSLKEGQRLRVLLVPVSALGSRLQPVRVVVANETSVEAAAAMADSGRYVAVDPSSMDAEIGPVAKSNADDEEDDDDDGSGVRLYRSIYETAMRQKIPRPVIDDLIRIYSYDVDFQRKVQAGDSFDVLYAGEDETNSAEHDEVLVTSLTLGGETKKFYRFQAPDDNSVDYYDDSGKSAKKFLVRKPVTDGIMRSGFGMRNHPILGYTKVHTGVDWAAPLGTPIFAAGNGTVEKAEWDGGYGKFVLLQHANGYETAYGHMTAYAKGIEPGVKVHQGQVIGFVGSTGLSTGAHVHYEIRVNSRFVDPMRIKLPRGRVLEGQMLAGFEQERERLDHLVARPAVRAPGQKTAQAQQ